MKLIRPVDVYMEYDFQHDIYEFMQEMQEIFRKSKSEADLSEEIEKLLTEDLSDRLLWIIGKNFTSIRNPKTDVGDISQVIPVDFSNSPIYCYIIYPSKFDIMAVTRETAKEVYETEVEKEKNCKSNFDWIMREFCKRGEK